MWAILDVSGTQFKVRQGDVIEVNRIHAGDQQELVLDRVLLIQDQQTRIGTPILSEARVVAEVIEHTRGPKVVAFKYRRRKNSATKKGHRQDKTLLRIKEIQYGTA